MEVNINLTDEQIEVLAVAFKRGRLDTQATANIFAELAVSAWIDWLSGNKRYRSLTDQYTEWIETLYLYLLSEHEVPSIDRIYNAFNVPYGQAQYISRVLSNKSLTRWRRKAIERLKNAMEEKLPEIEEWLNDGRSDSNAEIVVDQLASIELKLVVERIFRNDPESVAPPEFRSSSGIYSILIKAFCFRTIYRAIEL